MFKGPGSRVIPTTGVHGDDRDTEEEEEEETGDGGGTILISNA